MSTRGMYYSHKINIHKELITDIFPYGKWKKKIYKEIVIKKI